LIADTSVGLNAVAVKTTATGNRRTSAPAGPGVRVRGDAAHRLHVGRLGPKFADYLSLSF
jgi:hypothetical protein